MTNKPGYDTVSRSKLEFILLSTVFPVVSHNLNIKITHQHILKVFGIITLANDLMKNKIRCQLT